MKFYALERIALHQWIKPAVIIIAPPCIDIAGEVLFLSNVPRPKWVWKVISDTVCSIHAAVRKSIITTIKHDVKV